MLRVMKFGGTSVGDAEAISRTAKIVATGVGQGPVVVVVSAMSGVTNRLIEAAHRCAAGHQAENSELATALRKQHQAALHAIINDPARRTQIAAGMEEVIAEVERLCQGTALLGELTPRTLDAISSVGERLSAPLVAGVLCELGVRSVPVEATELIVTSHHHGGAEPLMDKTRERCQARLRPLIGDGIVPVVTGFIGAAADGALMTLGRGGSDYSATILGAALGAEETIIWTDVDGVMTADPRLVPEARTLDEISYIEAAELAYFGAKVLHPNTLRPLTETGVPVWIRNSFAPEKRGTKITPHGRASGGGVKALTAIRDVVLITVGGPGIVGMPDVVAKTFSATAAVRVNVLLISQSSSQSDICFIIHAVDAERAVAALRQTFALDLADQNVEHITVNPNIAIVAAVGENMHGTPGIAGRTFSALGRENVNIIAIAQGSSEYNISFVVEVDAMKKAVAAVHREFHLESPAGR
jgi:aspartate kinase